MLSRHQMIVLVCSSFALWAGAAWFIRLLASMMLDPAMGSLTFAATPIFAWLSVLLIRRVAGLALDQLMTGVALVGSIAMTLDGAVLNWFPAVYGSDEAGRRVGAAWLLWGYGTSLGIALIMIGLARAGSKRSRSGPVGR